MRGTRRCKIAAPATVPREKRWERNTKVGEKNEPRLFEGGTEAVQFTAHQDGLFSPFHLGQRKTEGRKETRRIPQRQRVTV